MAHPRDLKCLDDLIAELGGADAGTRSKGPCGLLLEHLQAARRDLLGSMPGEYRLSLQEAMESTACMADKSVRAEIKKRLRGLIDSGTPKQRPAAAPAIAYVLPGPAPLVPVI